jgi:hypothetical protein
MPLVPAFIINACRDLSWVAPDAARLVARGVHAVFDAIDSVDEQAHAVAGDVCNKLLWVEDALLLHDPERIESLRRAREQVAAWNATKASKAEGREGVATTSASSSTTPVRESAADGALGDASASPATSASTPEARALGQLVRELRAEVGRVEFTRARRRFPQLDLGEGEG